jgi:hypothetical protein
MFADLNSQVRRSISASLHPNRPGGGRIRRVRRQRGRRNPAGRAASVIETLEQRRLLAAVIGSIYQYPGPVQHVEQTFDADVSADLSIDDYALENLTTNSAIERAKLALAYQSPGNKALISFPGASNSGIAGQLPDGNYDLFLADPAVLGPGIESRFGFYHLIADADRDRAVSNGDFAILNGNYNNPGNFGQGDFNLDGTVNFADWSILSANFGRQMPTPITAPGAATANSLSSSAINVTWSAPASGTWDGYRVFRSLDGLDFEQIAEVGPTTLNYTDTSLADGTKYFYRVRPYTTANGNGETTNKTWAVTVLEAPTSVSASATSEGYLDITWTRNSSTEAGFNIERALSATGPWSEVGRTGGQATLWRDWDAAEGTTYHYRVTGFTPEAVSATSQTVSITNVALALPSGLWASSTTDAVTLNWENHSAVATGTRVQRATTSDFTANLITLADLPANASTYEDSGLAENLTYHYRLAPLTGAGAAGYLSFGQQTTLIAAPWDLATAEQANGDVVLTWDDRSAVESGYRVERATDLDFTSGLTVLGTTSSSVETFTDTTAGAGVYHYRVIATATGGVEAPSTSAFLATAGQAARPANPTFNLLGEALWTGTYNDAGTTRVLYAIRPGQSIFFSTRRAEFADSNGSWMTTANTVLNRDFEYVNSRLEWDFGDPGSRHNLLPGYTGGHNYANEGLYRVTLEVAYPDDPATTAVEATQRTMVAYVQVTLDQTATGVSPTLANNPAIADINYRDIYISRDGSPTADGTSKASRVTMAQGISLFNSLDSKSNVRVFFRRDQDKAHFQPSPTTTFDLAGANNVTFSPYLQSTGATPLRERARVALHRNVDGNQSLFAFSTSTTFVSVSGLELYVDGATRALSGRAADPRGKNITFRDLNLTKLYRGFETGSGTATPSTPVPDYLTAEGVLIQDVNRQRMINGTSGALTEVAYDDPNIVTGAYFIYGNSATRGLLMLGNKSGETTEAIQVTPTKTVPKDHVTRTFASDLLMYQNTFSNRTRLINSTTAQDGDKNVYTLRANKGRFIYWSDNITYGGATLLGAVDGGARDGSVRVQYIVIERNRFLQDPRDITGLNRDTHLARLDFTNFGIDGGVNPVADVMIRNNLYENPRGLSVDDPTARERGGFMTGPPERLTLVHNTFIHNQNEDLTITRKLRNAPWIRLFKARGAQSLNVMRGNLFVSQQGTAPGGPSNASEQLLVRLPGTTVAQAQAGNNLFRSGQVLDNVFPTAPENTRYRFEFDTARRAFVGTSLLPGWSDIFSDDVEVAVALDASRAPTTSAVDNGAREVDVLFGVAIDLHGNPRPTTSDTLTKGAVQR